MKAAKRPKATSTKDAMKINVSAIMSKRVKTAPPGTSVEAAISVMLEKEIGHLPIVDDDGVLMGIVSKTDLIRERFLDGEVEPVDHKTAVGFLDSLLSQGFHEDQESQRSVGDVMSKKVRTVRDTSTVAEAALTMAKYRVHGLPVVSDDNVLVGFLSTFDIVNWVAAN